MKRKNRGRVVIFLVTAFLCLILFVKVARTQSIPNPYPATTSTFPVALTSFQQWRPPLSIPGALSLASFQQWSSPLSIYGASSLALLGVPSQLGNAGQWYGYTLFGGFPSLTQPGRSGPNLKCRIKTDASVYDLGEPVIITAMIENSGGSSATVTFPAGQRIEVAVNDNDGRAWRLSSHMEEGQDGSPLSIRSGETISFEIRWDQLDDHGMMAPSGAYTIEAVLCAGDERYRKAASTEIAINGVPRFSSCDELIEKLKELRDGTIYEETDPSPHLSVSSHQSHTTSSTITPISFGQLSFPFSFTPSMVPFSTFSIPSYQTTSPFQIRTSSTTPPLVYHAPIEDEDEEDSSSSPSGPILGGGFPPWPIPSPGAAYGGLYGGMDMYGAGMGMYGYAMLAPTAYGFGAGYGGLPYSAFAGAGAWGGLGGYGLYAGYSTSFGGTAGYALPASGFGWGGYAATGGFSGSVRYRSASSGIDTRMKGSGDGETIKPIGADEADIVKGDGAYIYMIKGRSVRIIRAYPPEDLSELPGIDFPGMDFTPKQLYVDGNIMAVIGEEERGSETIRFEDGQAYLSPVHLRPTFTRVFLYDITDRTQVIRRRSLRFEAQYVQSRGTDDMLYLVMLEDPPYDLLDGDLPDTRAVLPVYSDSSVHGEGGGSVEVDAVCGCDDITYFPRYTQPRYLLVVGIPLHDHGQGIDAEVIFGDCDHVLSSTNGLYVASIDVEGDTPVTLVYRFVYTDEGILFAGSAKVEGVVIDSSCMHGHDGRFMITTNSAMAPLKSDLYMFNDRMRLTGVLSGLAPGEAIASVRFFDDRCYMVTGSEEYPFLVISLDDPADPWVAEELDILGGSEYLHLYAAGHILGFGREVQGSAGPGMRIALYDITDTSDPVLVGEEEIGDRKTGSALFSDYKALLVSPSGHLMAFPVTVTENVEGMPYPYQYIFQGAYVFAIDGSGLYRAAEITHHPAGMFPRPSYAPTGDHITRILCIGDLYCTVSENLIRMFDMQGHAEAGALLVQ